MKRIEALALTISKYSGGFDPEDEAFKLCNPGRLRSFSARTLQTSSDSRLRSFGTWLDGMRALVFDLQVKCGGKSRTHLKPAASLKDLLGIWEIRTMRKPLTFLKRAIGASDIFPTTPVSWFLEGSNG